MTIAITNQKGGVGKTTTVLNLGVYLAVEGKRVLLVDIDPQSNLTSGLGAKITDESDKKSVYHMLINKVDIGDILTKTRIEGLDILPASIELAGAEVELVSAMSRESILKKALENVKNNYDFILIDCPPSLGLLTVNGLVAANEVIIPVQSEYFALEGLGQLTNTIDLIKSNLNQRMELGGVILTMYDSRTNLSKDVTAEVKKFFEDKVFESIIPRNIKLSEAPSYSLSIYEYAPNSSGAIAYNNLAKELIGRLEKRNVLLRPNLQKEVE